ncbi:hypothetical protein D9756_002106 [Leucocoprinus leucothites]|uniref:BTB domain-containing protein n=1 Tax=Leucocoprinus leucothites TaxID=201217 RepID=A0A8H5LM42_9AGAR|nr:hypothetical protein D9756_002106 [Leucoagaricus leucothites]
MSLLHDYFHTRNLQLFQRFLLENSASGTSADKAHAQLSTSTGKSSYKKHGPLSGNVDVNGRDWLGRSVLHLAAASIEHLEYVRALLRHPAINVNLLDEESHWTPLHRALYNANIPAARLLLQRSDIDITLTDNEGYTAFDVYNSTLIGTKPAAEESESYADLYTWGTNVNAALGLGDSNDRVFPEHVSLQQKDGEEELEGKNLSARFQPVKVKDVVMSKLHTAVITSESGGNLRVCGFGSGGRLGPYSHTQYTLKPLSQLSQTITSVALGQDHTLALTKSGEVLSWGLNRFSQLGYPVDPPTNGRGTEELIQYTPRKVQGFLRKEVVKGVAASKCASACWTDDAVYTWGTNHGQLGYDKAAQPVQVLPRKVSRLTMPVISIAMTDNTMACLMQNRQVECFYNDGHHRINFPTHAFPSPIRPYRPPQAMKDSRMAKITSCGELFASLSYHGEVYIFSPTTTVTGPSTPSATTASNTGATSSSHNAQAQEGENPTSRSGGPFKCQRVWALRKKSSAVKDVALGADGSIIICTESGHVFVRTRNLTKLNLSQSSTNLFTSLSSSSTAAGTSTLGGSGTSQKAFKFHRIPFLQRVVKVCANATGAFGALRVEVPIKGIEVKGDMVGTEVGRVVPWLSYGKTEEDDDDDDVFGWKSQPRGVLGDVEGGDEFQQAKIKVHVRGGADSDHEDVEGEMEDEAVEGDIRALKGICDAIKREERMRVASDSDASDASTSKDEGGMSSEPEVERLPHGADMFVLCKQTGALFPAHKAILAARSEVLCRILSSSSLASSSIRDEKTKIRITCLPPPCTDDLNSRSLSPSLPQLRISNANPLSILIILTYLYSDNVLTIWDRRIAVAVAPYAQQLQLKWDVGRIRDEVAGLARMLELRDVLGVLERPVKVTVLPSYQQGGGGGFVKDLVRLFGSVNSLREKDRDKVEEVKEEEEEEESEEEEEKKINVEVPAALRPDVILELEDREVRTHSVILRSRSDLFKSFFDESDWTRNRWVSEDDGETGNGGWVVRINLKHLKWRVMEFVLKFMCCGCDKELFEMLEFVRNVDDLVEFMFEVIAAANELLLDRLILLCSSLILTYSSFHNACSILSDATHFSCMPLIDRIQSYITANMELFLESHMLDDIPQDLVYQLARYAQQKQKEKAPFVRDGALVDEAMVRWCNWLEDQDVPVPFVRSGKPWKERTKVLPIPKFEKKVLVRGGGGEKGLRKPPSVDDLFDMDYTENSGPTLTQQTQPAEAGPVWKAYVSPKVDMKAVMAEAAQDQIRIALASTRTPSKQPQQTPLLAATLPQVPSSSSPWRTLAPQVPRQGGDETSKSQVFGPPLSQPSTPQKQREGSRPSQSGSGSGGGPQGPLQPNVVTTPTKQTPGLNVSTPGAPPPSGPVMGPTITPLRMPVGSSKGNTGQRISSGSGKAWAHTRPTDTLTPVVPASQNTSRATASGTTSSSTVDTTNPKSVSFLAIQHSQKEEQLSFDDLHKDRRSLLEIQEEEKARREEETFMRWWQEEEARVKMEMEALEVFTRGGSSSGGGGGSSSGGKQRRGGGGGRGRGGGGGGSSSGGGERGERGEKRGGGGRGGPKGRKEGRQANQANANLTSSEGQPATPDTTSPSQSQSATANVISTAPTKSAQNNPRPPRYRKPSQKNFQHPRPHPHPHPHPSQQQQQLDPASSNT